MLAIENGCSLDRPSGVCSFPDGSGRESWIEWGYGIGELEVWSARVSSRRG